MIRRELVIRGVWRGGDSGSRRLPVEEGKGPAEWGNRVIEIGYERREIQRVSNGGGKGAGAEKDGVTRSLIV